ncbi:MAG: hypothetical protein QOI34_1646 [Verrucomicrobiota bacterium]
MWRVLCESNVNKPLSVKVQRLVTQHDMKRILFAIVVLGLMFFALPRAQAVDVSIDFFYDNLSGGSWVEVGDYGYCWQPDVVVRDTNWRPYSDGYWAYTDLGWTWVSYEDFGWATYHYGRWVRLADQGWVWAPGRDSDLEWGPAWVSWRTGGEYVGWAPLPPEVTIRGEAITGRLDADFDIGPGYYNFVDVRYIGAPVLRERIVPVNENVTYISQTVNVTNITYKNKVVYNYGPDINVINSRAERPIQRLKLERQDNVDFNAAARSGALTKVQGDKLVVAAPMVIRKTAQPPPPPRLKAKVASANVDKGWSVVGDEKAQTALKQKFRTEDPSKAQLSAGPGAAAQAASGASPAAATRVPPSATAADPSAQTGKGRNGRDDRLRRGMNARTGTAPATGTLPIESASPGVTGTRTDPAARENRDRGGHRNRPAVAPDSTTTAPEASGQTNATDETSQRGGGRRNRRAEQQNTSGQTQDATGGDQGQGQGRRARRLERQDGNAGPTAPAIEPRQVGGRHGGQGAAVQSGAPGSEGTDAQQGQGKQGRKNKPEVSPAPTP